MNCPASPPPERAMGNRETPRPRRTFLALLSAAISGLLVAVPTTIGALFFATPLRRRQAAAQSTRRDADGFVPLGINTAAIPDDGTPVSAKVVDDKIDAWNRYPAQEIGTVWLRKNEQGEVIAFNAICPHLGCLVDYRSARRDFFCPCHTSAFALDGTPTNQIPPRPMDALDVRVDPSAGGVVWVKFQNYRAGVPERIPV